MTAEELERAKSEGIEIQERDWADEEDGDLDSLVFSCVSSYLIQLTVSMQSSKAALTAIQALIPLLTPKHLELVALQISGWIDAIPL